MYRGPCDIKYMTTLTYNVLSFKGLIFLNIFHGLICRSNILVGLCKVPNPLCHSKASKGGFIKYGSRGTINGI